MQDSDVTLVALYDWTCRIEHELRDLQSSFPECLKDDRNRLVMSLRCLRISCEVRIRPKMVKRDGAEQTRTVPRDHPPERPF